MLPRCRRRGYCLFCRTACADAANLLCLPRAWISLTPRLLPERSMLVLPPPLPDSAAP